MKPELLSRCGRVKSGCLFLRTFTGELDLERRATACLAIFRTMCEALNIARILEAIIYT